MSRFEVDSQNEIFSLDAFPSLESLAGDLRPLQA